MITFFLDTNRINARSKCSYMNELESLAREGKCELLMPRVAWSEAEKGNNEDSKNKTWSYYFIGLEHTESQRYWYREIENIVFPYGAITTNQQNDVWILVTAREMQYPLITDEGDSKSQKGGMLGNRVKLNGIGIQVVRDSEAVEMILKSENT
jgi:hypothetical protein